MGIFLLENRGGGGTNEKRDMKQRKIVVMTGYVLISALLRSCHVG